MPISTISFEHVQESGLLSLVGADNQVDQNDFSLTADIPVGLSTVPCSGELLSLVLVSRETGTGAVQTPTGHVIFLDADPNTTAGDTALTAAEWATAIGQVEIESGDWISDANGALAFKQIAIAFHKLSTLYAVWLHTDATSYNDGAGDDETLDLNVWFRKDS